MCLKCHDPNYIFKHKDPDHKCIIGRKKKSKYTCSNDSCTVHMWVCSDHKDENKKCLEDFKNEISNRFKLSFGYIVSIPFISATSFDSPAKKGKNAKKREPNQE